MINTLEAERWDADYRNGRYADAPAIPYAQEVIDQLGEEGRELLGLYIGCGNGRNYLAMLQAGLNLTGIDISSVALSQLVERLPAAEDRVLRRSFLDMPSANVWDYIVSIQNFQLGTAATVAANFARSHSALRPGGRLFLRINASDTEVYHRHEVIDGRQTGTRTIRYLEGSKKDLAVRFFSRQELGKLASRHNFEVVAPLKHVKEPREEPKDGTWSQWETTWRKPS